MPWLQLRKHDKENNIINGGRRSCDCGCGCVAKLHIIVTHDKRSLRIAAAGYAKTHGESCSCLFLHCSPAVARRCQRNRSSWTTFAHGQCTTALGRPARTRLATAPLGLDDDAAMQQPHPPPPSYSHQVDNAKSNRIKNHRTHISSMRLCVHQVWARQHASLSADLKVVIC